MLQHAAALTHDLDRMAGEVFLVWPWFRQMREGRPRTARRMSHHRTAARKVSGIAGCVPHVTAFERLVD